MERNMTHSAARTLGRRRRLRLDPKGLIAIKRDVHEFDVAAPAEAYAEAFAQVLTDPRSTFGDFRVKRPVDRIGQAFEPGERFQGCFSVHKALRRVERPGLGKWSQRLLGSAPGSGLVSWLEDRFLSNYAEVKDISVSPKDYRVNYVYLEGTPIAGSTTFVIERRGDELCRIKQIFEYQEQDGMALATFQRLGLKLHDRVVWDQVHQAAERIGAKVVSASMPREYGGA